MILSDNCLLEYYTTSIYQYLKGILRHCIIATRLDFNKSVYVAIYYVAGLH